MRKLLKAFGIAAIILALVACSTASPSASPTTSAAAETSQPSASGSSTQPSASGGEGLAAAQAELDKFSTIPAFTPPGAPLDGKAIAAGKSVFIMATSDQIPYNHEFNVVTQQYGEKVGFKVTAYPTTGQQDEWVRGFQLAISSKVDLIDLTAGLDYRQLIPQIQQATAAGIPVLTSTFGDVGDPTPEYLAAGVPLGYSQAGRLISDYAIVKSNGTGHFLEINCPDCAQSEFVSSGIQGAVKDNCPGCTLTTIDVPVAQWATQMQVLVQSALTKDPEISWVLPHYDSESSFVIPALKTVNRTDVGIASFNGTPSILDLLKKGDIAMDVGEDVAWAGAATVDSMLRVLGKVEPSKGTIDEHIPLRVFDSTNVSEVGTPATYNSGFGNVADEYLKLWGLE